MRFSVFAGGVLALACASADPVFAQGLTLQDVVERARTRAPEVVAAIARVDEARGQLLTASARFRDNPVLNLEAGPRSGSARTTWDVLVGAGQTFETGGQRGARIASAEAEVSRARASADEVARTLVRDVAIAYVRAVAAGERLRVVQEAETTAIQLQAATERRYQAGDIAAVDLNLARIAAARATAERIAVEAGRQETLRPIRIALGMPADAQLELAGSLDRAPAARPTLVAALDESPVLRALMAEIAKAEADARLGAALRKPDLGLGVTARREQDDHIVTGGLTITLPVFDKGQGVQAEATARLHRLTQERDSTRRTLEVEVEVGLRLFEQRRAAADALRAAALPAADDNDALAARSLDAGEMSLINFLLIRQDAAATRLAYIDALADAAAASIEVDAAAGVLR